MAERAIPIWHATSNHTTYDRMSEDIFAEALCHLPRNGAPGQEGLSYWLRLDDLLLVFVHTLCTDLGGEGYVETSWLREVLRQNKDAKHKIVVGHHPVFSVNGFSGAYGRDVGPECGPTFWDTLVEAGVLAYFCSHILAFDVQVHRGVLQVCTAGAGTGHRMPEGIEYLHCVQAALDDNGLRYQVLDTDGVAREGLSWPISLPPAENWRALPPGRHPAPSDILATAGRPIILRFSGTAATDGIGTEQTLLTAFDEGSRSKLWIGFRGAAQRLTVLMAPDKGRSPFYGLGPSVPAGRPFEFTIVIHPGMGPGGILVREGDESLWSSMSTTSPWGAERLRWPSTFGIGFAQQGKDDRPFRGWLNRCSLAVCGT
ncbi:hypothetical protein ABID21_004116 [Pseudorhizobium tarimense]|uniref:Calcineurin-like phosphoesterase domain-containing protein n=1 Tax=Pseudorhizobium tarimense TaxID=1079109 RepID=A0ABV2HBT1_9HYPH|nr:hypothetical protein [Pseudorhizobium tarimense]MCJ8521062.1 hypothetical protein [Pseudorhizobium tarimense]